jgi:hypothetical protein
MVESSALNSLIIIVRNADENGNVAALLEVEDNSGVLDASHDVSRSKRCWGST